MKMMERHEFILNLLQSKGEITFNELHAQIPSVSEITLRRDLQQLDQDKKLVRTYGGARSLETVVSYHEDIIQNRLLKNSEEKKTIAQKMVPLIEDNMNLFLDSGSTCTILAGQMPDRQYSVTTIGLTCALELSRLNHPKIVMVGGRVNQNSHSVNGSVSIAQLENEYFNMAIISVSGYVSGVGFMTTVAEDYLLKRKVISQSQKVVVLMDHTKINQWGSHLIATPGEIYAVIGDGRLPEAVVQDWSSKGILIL